MPDQNWTRNEIKKGEGLEDYMLIVEYLSVLVLNVCLNADFMILDITDSY
jgi:hypothetical protein